jgi:hypothetical protein
MDAIDKQKAIDLLKTNFSDKQIELMSTLLKAIKKEGLVLCVDWSHYLANSFNISLDHAVALIEAFTDEN